MSDEHDPKIARLTMAQRHRAVKLEDSVIENPEAYAALIVYQGDALEALQKRVAELEGKLLDIEQLLYEPMNEFIFISAIAIRDILEQTDE